MFLVLCLIGRERERGRGQPSAECVLTLITGLCCARKVKWCEQQITIKSVNLVWVNVHDGRICVDN